LQYRDESMPSSCHPRPATLRPPSRSREICRRLTADGSCSLRIVSESCHQSPSTGPRRPSVSIALRSLSLIAGITSSPAPGSYRTEVSPSRSLGSFEPSAWRMNVRRIPSAPPKRPASNTTLSRGDACPDCEASVVVQSSWAKTNAAKSTSWESSTSRSSVERPGLKVVVQGSTSATSSSPRVISSISVACAPDDPRKMRGLFMPRTAASLLRRPHPRRPEGPRGCDLELLDPVAVRERHLLVPGEHALAEVVDVEDAVHPVAVRALRREGDGDRPRLAGPELQRRVVGAVDQHPPPVVGRRVGVAVERLHAREHPDGRRPRGRAVERPEERRCEEPRAVR